VVKTLADLSPQPKSPGVRKLTIFKELTSHACASKSIRSLFTNRSSILIFVNHFANGDKNQFDMVLGSYSASISMAPPFHTIQY